MFLCMTLEMPNLCYDIFVCFRKTKQNARIPFLLKFYDMNVIELQCKEKYDIAKNKNEIPLYPKFCKI